MSVIKGKIDKWTQIFCLYKHRRTGLPRIADTADQYKQRLVIPNKKMYDKIEKALKKGEAVYVKYEYTGGFLPKIRELEVRKTRKKRRSSIYCPVRR